MRKWEGICWKRLGFLALTQPTCPTVALLDVVELCSCFRKVSCFYRPNERAGLHQSHAPEDTLRKHLHFRAFDLWQELYFHAYHTLGGRILTAAKMWGVEVKLGKTIKWETQRRVEWEAVRAGVLSRHTAHVWRVLMNIPSITLSWKRHTALRRKWINTV